MSERPCLSVIVASYNAGRTIESCLRSLMNQKTNKAFEVIVVDSSTDNTASIVSRKFPDVRLRSFHQRKYCGDARNIGISAARGEIISFIDADCVAEDDWVEQIVKSHHSPVLAIGGAIGNANPECFVGWAAYFCEFSSWMPSRRRCRMDDIAGGNMSYKKEAFEKYGRFIEGSYCSDTQFHWRLAKAGHDLLFDPSMRVHHKNISKLESFLKHEFMHGRSFGRVRVLYGDFPLKRRAAYVAFSFLVALKLFLKVFLNNVRTGAHLAKFFVVSPLVALGLVSWVSGEIAGYLKPCGQGGTLSIRPRHPNTEQRLDGISKANL
jgi:glycosyltransferase involved in cell wall biosynthesis